MLEDITLGVAAGDRIGVVGANGDGKSTLLRLIAGVEQPDSGVVTRAGDLAPRAARPGRRPRRAGTIREELVGGRGRPRVGRRQRLPDRAGRPARAASRSIASPRGSTRRRIRCPAASADASRWRGCCSTAPTCSSSTSRPTTSTSRQSTGSPGIWPRGGARCSWSPTTGGSSTRSARRRGRSPTARSTGTRAATRPTCSPRAERDRQEAARDDRRRQLVRKELAWLRRGPPARTAKPKFRIEAANALIADEPRAARPRRAAAVRDRPARRPGARRRRRLARLRRTQQVLRRLTWRLGPGDRVALVGVNGSGKTTLLKLLAGRAAADGRRRRARRHRPAGASVPGHRRDPGSPARARVARGGARAGDAQRRPRDHRGDAVRPLRLPRRPVADARCATSPAASGAACS